MGHSALISLFHILIYRQIIATTVTSYISFEIMSNANREFKNVSVPNLRANILISTAALKTSLN